MTFKNYDDNEIDTTLLNETTLRDTRIKMAVKNIFQPDELRTTKMGLSMLEADLVLKKILGTSKKINENLSDLCDITGEIYSFSGFWKLIPYDVELLGNNINFTKRNISVVIHSFEIKPDPKINHLIEKRYKYIKEFEKKITDIYDTLKIKYSTMKKNTLVELEEITKALSIALIIKSNNCDYDLGKINKYTKINNKTCIFKEYTYLIPRYDSEEYRVGGVSIMISDVVFFQNYKNQIKTLLRTGLMDKQMQDVLVNSPDLHNVLDYYLTNNFVFSYGTFIPWDEFNFVSYEKEFKKNFNELTEIYLMVNQNYDEDKLTEYLYKFAIKYPTNEFCNLLLDNMSLSSIFDELKTIIIEKLLEIGFPDEDLICPDEDLICPDENPISDNGNLIFTENKFIKMEEFNFDIYEKEFKKFLFELKQIYMEIFEKYGTNEKKLKISLKKFALKYPTNKFCNLISNNIDKPIFDDLNFIIMNKL